MCQNYPGNLFPKHLSFLQELHLLYVLCYMIARLLLSEYKYLVLGLVCFRLVWGFVGSHYARFSQFVKSPEKVISYLKDVYAKREKRYLDK